MKKTLIYLSILIIITWVMFLFVSKNYPENIVEICLKNYVSPEQVAYAVNNLEAYDYLNVYDIFSYDEKASVYSGNINLFLYNKKRQENGFTFNNNEVIMGDNFMEDNFNYNLLGEKYLSSYGEYDVNCILENNDRVYYRDLEILKSSMIKSQKIYLSLLNTRKTYMNPSNTVKALEYNGIDAAKSIAYIDVINFLKKLLMLLITIVTILIFIIVWRKNKKIGKNILSTYKATKYDIEIKDFIIKKDNLRLMIKLLFTAFLQLINGIIIIYLVASFVRIPLGIDVDITSLKSIIGAAITFIDLLKYYFLNGFTDISFMIVKIIIIYLFISLLFYMINSIMVNKKILQ